MSLSLAPSTVALETNLARKGFVALGAATDAEFEGTDLLGHIRINRRLRPVDLEVLAWLSAAFRAEDPLDRKRDPSVRFSRSRLAHDLFARVPGGKERRIVTESLERLAAARVDFDGYDARLGKLARFEGVGLLDWVESSAGRRCGAALAPWLRAQLEAEYVTFLDWEIMALLSWM